MHLEQIDQTFLTFSVAYIQCTIDENNIGAPKKQTKSLLHLVISPIRHLLLFLAFKDYSKKVKKI